MRPANRTLYHADALHLMERLDDGLFTLVYLDPPWGTMLRNHEEITEYRRFISRLVQQAWRVLSNKGSLYVQLPATSHTDTDYRLLLNQCVGRSHSYVITWKDPRITNVSGSRENHEEILRYNRSSDTVHNIIKRPADLSRYANADSRGPYLLCDITTTLRTPSRVYEWRGHFPPKGRAWMFSPQKMDQYFADGRIVETGRTLRLKRYEDETTAQDIGTIWDDIPIHHRRDCRYPGAKPPELCRRILHQATNVDDWILDPMCGSGQMLLQAAAMGRKWAGCDATAEAIELTKHQFVEQDGANLRLPIEVAEDQVLANERVWAQYEDVFLSITDLTAARRKLSTLVSFLEVFKSELLAEGADDEDILMALHEAVPRLRWLVSDMAKRACAAEFKETFSGFNGIEDNSQEFLITARIVLDTLPADMDFSVVSVSAWKAIENELGMKLFLPLRQAFTDRGAIDPETFNSDKAGTNGKEALELARFLESGRTPALGTMRFILNKVVTSKKSIQKSAALKLLQGYISGTFLSPKILFEKDGVYALWTQDNIDAYRNGAVHTSTFTKDRATESLRFVLELLGVLSTGLERQAAAETGNMTKTNDEMNK